MVKRIISIVVIFVILLALAIYESITVAKVNKKLVADVDRLYEQTLENSDNIVGIAPDVKDVKDKWDKDKVVMCTFFSHKDLIYISESLNRLYGSVINNDYDNTIIEINLLKQYVQLTKQITEFNFQNLF